MDCYPRFKRSELAKQCLLAEMEGKPLPVELDDKKTAPPAGDGIGIWKMHRVKSDLLPDHTPSHCALNSLGIRFWTLSVGSPFPNP